jgi:molybdate transport system regulatory protein
MKISARNRFFGTVTGIRTGAVHDEVTLEFAPARSLVATITRESREALGLAEGVEAAALVKASSVLLMTESDGLRFSARNQLPGVIAQVNRGAVNAEVVVDVLDGPSVVAVVTLGSVDELALSPGQTVTALFKASSVFLARRL